jgi:hypothetical protein
MVLELCGTNLNGGDGVGMGMVWGVGGTGVHRTQKGRKEVPKTPAITTYVHSNI